MKTISFEEITDLYNECGLDCSIEININNSINEGNLNNVLNANYVAVNKMVNKYETIE